MTWQLRTIGSTGTERLGERLGKLLKPPIVLELRSDLGGGKTTFIRGLVRGVGSKDNVTSPTFTLSRIYQAGDLQIHHFDFYRLNDAGILADQLAESVDDNKTVVAVEWADIVEDILPEERLSIEFKPVAGGIEERRIIIKYPQSKRQLIAELETEWPESRP